MNTYGAFKQKQLYFLTFSFLVFVRKSLRRISTVEFVKTIFINKSYVQCTCIGCNALAFAVRHFNAKRHFNVKEALQC